MDPDVSLTLPQIKDRYDLIAGRDTTIRRIKYKLEVFSISKAAYKSLCHDTCKTPYFRCIVTQY